MADREKYPPVNWHKVIELIFEGDNAMGKTYYQEYNESKRASFSAKEHEALDDCVEWVDKNWQDFSPEEYPQIFTLVSGPDNKREVYRNEFFHVLYAYEYGYVDILPLDED